jgi:steroid-24-oyl-CoA synthetase
MQAVLNDVIAELTAPGQPFEITQATVGGQTLKVWANAPKTLREFWLNCAAHGDNDYLVYEDERITYAQAHERVARIANWLVSNGVTRGDRVAIAMRNYPEWLLSYWAITCVGAVSVGVNAWWVAEELKYGLADSGAKLLICDRERLQRFQEIEDDFPHMQVVSVRHEDPAGSTTPWADVLLAPPELPESDIDPEDDACIFYTSGTTGFPKGAQLTHRGCTNNVISTFFSTYSQLIATGRINEQKGIKREPSATKQQATIIAAPLFHVTTNNCSAHLQTYLGGKLVHMYKWDAGEALRIIEKERITAFSSVPIMTREMLAHPDFEKRDTSSMTSFTGGGAPVQADLVEKVSEQGGGALPGQGYGLTETCGIAAGSFGVFLQGKPGSVGRVVPIFDVCTIDAEGNQLPLGETGEVCLRSPQIIKGYLNRPEATAETIVDGWLHTGDIGYLDDEHYLYLVDRAKDMVLRGGENVYCSEVEVALYKYPGVQECVVFSVPDERLGEEVGAALVIESDADISAEDIRSFCKDHLSSYKIPRYIWLLDTPLPRNATGKFIKRDLQTSLAIENAK